MASTSQADAKRARKREKKLKRQQEEAQEKKLLEAQTPDGEEAHQVRKWEKKQEKKRKRQQAEDAATIKVVDTTFSLIGQAQPSKREKKRQRQDPTTGSGGEKQIAGKKMSKSKNKRQRQQGEAAATASSLSEPHLDTKEQTLRGKQASAPSASSAPAKPLALSVTTALVCDNSALTKDTSQLDEQLHLQLLQSSPPQLKDYHRVREARRQHQEKAVARSVVNDGESRRQYNHHHPCAHTCTPRTRIRASSRCQCSTWWCQCSIRRCEWSIRWYQGYGTRSPGSPLPIADCRHHAPRPSSLATRRAHLTLRTCVHITHLTCRRRQALALPLPRPYPHLILYRRHAQGRSDSQWEVHCH